MEGQAVRSEAHDPPGGNFYPAPPSPLVPRLRSVALAVVLAGATFAVLPFFGLLSASVHERLELREAPPVVAHTPPVRAARPRARKDERPKRRPKLRKPSPRRKRRRMQALPEALWARLSLSMSGLAPGAGDFSLDFGLGPDPLEAPEDAGPIVFDLAQLDSPPRPLVRIRPVYPFRARDRGIEGFVRLRFIVAADGSVREVSVLNSEPEGVFDRAAMAALRRSRFTPGTKDGAPVASRVRVTVRFRLEEE